MLIATCSICNEIIQEGERAVESVDYLGKMTVVHEDCFVGVNEAERAEEAKQEAFDSSRGVGI